MKPVRGKLLIESSTTNKEALKERTLNMQCTWSVTLEPSIGTKKK